MKHDTGSLSHTMELQVSYRICAEIQETGDIWEN